MSEHNEKVRIIQELVPGKQISIAHIIANPDKILYKKLGLDPAVDYNKSAIGIVTISPAETAIIIADVAIKNSGAEIGPFFGYVNCDGYSFTGSGSFGITLQLLQKCTWLYCL